AMNGVEGVEAARRLQPDLVLCDINMPKMDGYEVLTTLRSDAVTNQIPLMFLTAFVDRDFQRRGMALGAEDYLTKPFTPSELIEAVETQLKKVVERKREFEQLRTSIVSSLPHELRTPLTGIITCADLLMMDIEDGTFDPHRAEQTLRIIQNSGKRLQRLIENHLVYSQLEVSMGERTHREKLRLGEGITNPTVVYLHAAQQAAEERIGDLVHESSAEGTISISEMNLHKIITELVLNAVKFSDPGTPITLRSAIQNGSYQITVADEGRGMKPEQVQSIGAYKQFEREYYEHQGIGLGLIIVLQMAALHEGTVDVESTPHQGTRVTVSLPLLADDSA
ncbi:MAG: hybrid sensor histidine kinase/response regulator, partial [Chloroflexota bacterium]